MTPTAYIHDAMKKGADLSVPAEVEAGSPTLADAQLEP